MDTSHPAPIEEADLYGFQLKLDVKQQAVRLQCDGSSRRAEGNWISVAQQQQLPPGTKLKGMIRLVGLTLTCSCTRYVGGTLPSCAVLPQGVPPTLRTLVWLQVSGAAAKQAAVASNYFSNMCLAGEQSPFLKEIDKVSTSPAVCCCCQITRA
jgi:hypothetical protein